MKPCQPHFVFSYAHSICLGGHYYLTNNMQTTLQGLIHTFVLHNFLTNTSHPTRVLLRRLVLFYHMGLIEKEIPASGMSFIFCSSFNLNLMSILDPAASHLPEIHNIDGLMNLLSACVLVVLGNVLDFRTYRAPTQEENQKANKNQQILIDHESMTSTLFLSMKDLLSVILGVLLYISLTGSDSFVSLLVLEVKLFKICHLPSLSKLHKP